MGDEVGVSIAKALATNTVLEALDFSSNGSGDLSGTAFEHILFTNYALQGLNLADNYYSETAVEAIADCFRVNASLEDLRLEIPFRRYHIPVPRVKNESLARNTANQRQKHGTLFMRLFLLLCI